MEYKNKHLKIVNEIGKKGEELACMFLVKRGYSIIERNYLKRWGEIDIVAEKDDKLLFVEVKSVSCKKFKDVSCETGYRPEENIHIQKLQRLKRVVESYMLENNASHRDWKFCAITVLIDQATRVARVSLIPDIVL